MRISQTNTGSSFVCVFNLFVVKKGLVNNNSVSSKDFPLVSGRQRNQNSHPMRVTQAIKRNVPKWKGK